MSERHRAMPRATASRMAATASRMAATVWRAVRSVAVAFRNSPVGYAIGRGSHLLGIGGRSGGPLDAYGAVSTLFSVVTLLAGSTAQVEWGMCRKRRPSEQDGERVDVAQHAAIALWNRPNAFMSRSELVERAQQHIELAGETFLVVERLGSMPIALWPVRPDRMTEVPDKDAFLLGWDYTEPDGTLTRLATEEVIHIQTPDPNDVYRGISPVRALTADLESVALGAEYTRNFFRNSAIPGGIVEAPGQLTDADFDRFQTRWGESHRGTSNAHRVGIIENGMKWVNANYTFKEMEFLGIRNLGRELILEAYGVHKHMIGLSDDVNRANAVAADASFAKWKMVPRLERIMQALNSQLLPLFGATASGVEFFYCSPVDDDIEVKAKVAMENAKAVALLVGVGFDPSGCLSAYGLPDIPWTGQVASGSAATTASAGGDVSIPMGALPGRQNVYLNRIEAGV